jgi:quercetin dioxygenase-like cupin family protein
MSDYTTVFGSLENYRKGGVAIIEDDPRNYVFSNLFEVAQRSQPYERVAVAKNFQYVIEAVRAEGTSPWFAAAHDEFALCMDGSVEVHLVKLADPGLVPAGRQGAIRLEDNPEGRKMGRILLGRGHMALLPKGASYRFHADRPGALMIQTMEGPLTVQRWAEICQTH